MMSGSVCRETPPVRGELLWPVANVDFRLESVGRFSVRYLPDHHMLQWPDGNGSFGGQGLTVRGFMCPNQTMLIRDLAVRARLVACGLSFRDVCALDGADMADTTLTGELRNRLPRGSRDGFDRRMSEHDEIDSAEDDEDPFSPLKDEALEEHEHMDGRPISISNTAWSGGSAA